MRVADILLNRGFTRPWGNPKIDVGLAVTLVQDYVRESAIVEATNVYEYVRNQPEIDLYALPCAAPPHDRMLIEWQQHNGKRMALLCLCSSASHSKFTIGDRKPEGPPGENGFRNLAPDLDENGNLRSGTDMWLSDHLPNQLAWNHVRWVWSVEVFQEDSGKVYGPLSVCRAALDEWGKLLDVTYQAHLPAGNVESLTLHPFVIFLHTLNFMQCANIRTEYIAPSEKLSRKHRKQGHIKDRLVGYHVLRIAPSGPATKERSSGAGGSGLVAFHPVRGEFHHYGDCCPGLHAPKGLLFGKLTGRYWVPAHVRGNPERGTVRQSFEMQPVTEVPWEPDE